MENGMTNDEFEASYKFVKELENINCIHDWYETENYYIKCKNCNKLKDMKTKKVTELEVRVRRVPRT